MKSNRCWRRLIACSALLAMGMASASAAGHKEYPHDFRFVVGEYELSFSTPKEFLTDLWGHPDHYSPQWIKGHPGEGTSATYFDHAHMFSGPIWVGNYAYLEFSFIIHEADISYAAPVASMEQLEGYLKWYFESTGRIQFRDFSKKTISGYEWLQVSSRRRPDRAGHPRDDEGIALWYPVGGRRSLLVGCAITELIPNKTSRWLTDAHKMRDQILGSIIFRKRTK